jgi:flavin reductase (DIM6/NTAB) family NADH-FMN oxidoreductase RutF
MGRVVGSLVVVAARDEDASSAMLASWVSQASFDPPAITIAVKKDRAMGGLLKPGARFVVSIVPEAKARASATARGAQKPSRPAAAARARLPAQQAVS